MSNGIGLDPGTLTSVTVTITSTSGRKLALFSDQNLTVSTTNPLVVGALTKVWVGEDVAGAQVSMLSGGVEVATVTGTPLSYNFSGGEISTVKAYDGPLTPAMANANFVPKTEQGSDSKAFLLLGGDHPYTQWAGNGMGKAYRDRGITPYMAVNTDANGLEPGGNAVDILAWSALAGTNAEIISHGARHIQDWTRINTGIKILYSGANATATVQITATQIICTAGGGDSVTLTLAGLTLAQVQTQIQAAGSWTVTLAPELTGTETASSLLQIAATSVKGATVLFCAGGGITVIYTGTSYRQAWVQVNSGRLKLYGDGRRLLDVSTSATLTSLVASLNGVSGFVAALCDNQKSGNATFESYLSGNELGGSLLTVNGGESCVGYGALLPAGLPRWYMIERQMQRAVDQSAANGVTVKDFASSGSAFIRPLTGGHEQFTTFRGNALQSVDNNYPIHVAVPAYRASTFRPVQSLTQTNFPASSGRLPALVQALADSPGFLIDGLMHKVLPDGSSTYSFPNTDSYYDQTETDFISFLNSVQTQVNAGKVVVLAPSRARATLAAATPPKNFVFNPKFRTSGESLQNVTPSSLLIVPGWRLLTAAADYSAATADGNGGLTFTTASTTARYGVSQLMYLEPGKTYEFGCMVEISNYTSGNGVSLAMNVNRGYERNDGYNGQLSSTSRWAVGPAEHVKMRFTVPAPEELQKARIISQSFGSGIDMSTNKNIKLKFFGKTLDNLDLSAGAALNTSVKAAEAAAAINAALLAAVKAGTFNGEFLNLARSENNTLIIELPLRGSDVSTFTLTATAATATDITATVFGSADNFAVSGYASDQDGLLMPLEFRIQHQLAVGTTYRISRPYCQEHRIQ